MAKGNNISPLNPAVICGTFFGIGFIKFAPGTFGSLAALPIAFIVFMIANHSASDLNHIIAITSITTLILAVISTYLGIWATEIYLNKTNKSDPSEIVIDEVAGQLFAVAICFPSLLLLLDRLNHNHYILSFLGLLMLPFASFRFFDIKKPSVIGWTDKNIKGAKGVMVDDLISGIVAGILCATIFYGLFKYV